MKLENALKFYGGVIPYPGLEEVREGVGEAGSEYDVMVSKVSIFN